MSYIAEAVQRARHLGQSADAAAAWRELLAQTHVDEADYSDWARELAFLYTRMGRELSAARVHEYLLNIDPALQLYSTHGSARDQGRILRFGKRLREASLRYRDASLFAHAARASEENNDVKEALALYEQLTRTKEATGETYLSGLAALNAGRIAMKLGQKDRAFQLLAVATRVLEEEADNREQRGDREGSFRCYLSLMQIGKVEASYEHLAEGYLNCIRILKAKADRFFTMQYYHDFISHSDELGELHSVAELYREAGEYAKRVGFIYADFFLHEAGQAWMRVARTAQERANPPELVENALLAAVACFNRIEDDHAVALCYQELAELPLNDVKRERYATLSRELHAIAGTKQRDPPPAFPEYFRRRLVVPEIWLRDLTEAEAGTDIPDAIGRLVGDHKNVWEVQRRKALLIALSYDDHIASGGDPRRIQPSLVERIGELGHPAAVRPLLAMYEHGDEETKVLVVQRGSSLKQKEAFALIDKALGEGPGRLFEEGTTALRRMTFAQALDNLVRLFNAHENGDVRDACMRSIAAIGTDEACEFLLDVVRSNASNLGARSRALLESNAQERMLSALERNRRQEPDPSLRLFISRLVDKIRAQRGAAAL